MLFCSILPSDTHAKGHVSGELCFTIDNQLLSNSFITKLVNIEKDLLGNN